MLSLPLGTGVAVMRPGATRTWTGPAFTTGTYVPGDKSFYLRFQILPSAPLTVLPPVLRLTLIGSYSPMATGTRIVNDTISLGTSSSIAGNAATGALGGLFSLGTSGFSLADLNAGNVYLWLGYRADPETYTSYSASVSPTSPVEVTGGMSASSSPTFTVSTSGPGDYAVVDLTVASWGGGYDDGFAIGYSGSASVNNGQGATDSGPIMAPTMDEEIPGARLASNSVRYLIPTSQPRTISPTASCGLTTASPGNVAKVSHSVSTAIVTPDGSTLSVGPLSLEYFEMGNGGGLGGALSSAKGPMCLSEGEMTTRYFGDTATFYVQTTQYSTGAAMDASSAPTYRVYEQATSTPLLTGTTALLDNTNTIGLYSGQVAVTSENGFEVGKTYCVRVSASVDSVNQAGIVDQFVVRVAPATAVDVPLASENADAVWGATRSEAIHMSPVTYGPMVDLVLKMLTNRLVKSGNVVTVYDDFNDPLGTQGYSVTETGFDRSKGSLP